MLCIQDNFLASACSFLLVCVSCILMCMYHKGLNFNIKSLILSYYVFDFLNTKPVFGILTNNIVTFFYPKNFHETRQNKGRSVHTVSC